MPALATYEQAVSPENVAKVSLTGLSFILGSHLTANGIVIDFNSNTPLDTL